MSHIFFYIIYLMKKNGDNPKHPLFKSKYVSMCTVITLINLN